MGGLRRVRQNTWLERKRTTPFKFHVPEKIVKGLTWEYSSTLRQVRLQVHNNEQVIPSSQSCLHRIANWVEEDDRSLSGDHAKQQVNGILLAFILKIGDVCPDRSIRAQVAARRLTCQHSLSHH